MQYFEIFNYMASTIRILIDNIEEDFFLHYDGKTWKKAQSIKKILKQDLPELFGSRDEFISSLLERSLIEKLENTRENIVEKIIMI